MRRPLGLLLAAALLAPQAGAAGSYPVAVRGGDDRSFSAAPPGAARPAGGYDAVVVGGGLAGLTAAAYLSERGKRVLLVEKEAALGGLAFGGVFKSGVPFNRGAAYWAAPFDEEGRILEHLGLGNYKEANSIPEPIDSYLWNGRLYPGLWEDHTLRELPASFELFRHELRKANAEGLIPNQPFEDEKNLSLDALSAAAWIRGMPERTAAREDGESKAVLARLRADVRLRRDDPMADVVDLMDLYCRSALGATAGSLSAAAFANFYISEIETRYSSPMGTGQAARVLEHLLAGRRHLVRIELRAKAVRVRDAGAVAEVVYLQGGKAWKARAPYVVWAAQLMRAPEIVEGLEKADPGKARAIRGLSYSHYLIHVVSVEGHPWRATYDTWVRPADYRPDDFTDVIAGRWMDPAVRGFEGMRAFEKDPPDRQGLFTIYHPYLHAADTRSSGKSRRGHAEGIARRAVSRMIEVMGPAVKERGGGAIEVTSVETSQWPYSIHIAGPGFFTSSAPALRRPAGRVFFANNNLGTPSFEEALYRGHCAANNVLKREDPAFQQEPWSRCRLE